MLQQRIQAAIDAVKTQVELLRSSLGTAEVSVKADLSYVTTTDVTISHAITEALRRQFPEDQFFSEEGMQVTESVPMDAEFVWILDPVDGTHNFAAGIPLVAISVGLLHKGKPVYGVVYDLSCETLMHGGPGIGAWQNDVQLQSPKDVFEPQSLINLHCPLPPQFVSALEPVLTDRLCRVRMLGSTVVVMSYIALGKLQGSVEQELNIWDFVACYAILEALGVPFHFFKGSPFPLLVWEHPPRTVGFYVGVPAFCKYMQTLLK